MLGYLFFTLFGSIISIQRNSFDLGPNSLFGVLFVIEQLVTSHYMLLCVIMCMYVILL